VVKLDRWRGGGAARGGASWPRQRAWGRASRR